MGQSRGGQAEREGENGDTTVCPPFQFHSPDGNLPSAFSPCHVTHLSSSQILTLYTNLMLIFKTPCRQTKFSS